MRKEEKNQLIDELVVDLQTNPNFYITDASELTVAKTNDLRRKCFNNNIQMKVVKNTLLRKAMERSGTDYSSLFTVLEGPTAVMFSETGNAPAKLIKEFRKTNPKPVLKAAWVEECPYIGDNQIDALVAVKSRLELIADVVALLQSPAKNVVSALQSGKNTLAGLVKTLSEREQ
jgi:large subunit ribosomal protein L10